MCPVWARIFHFVILGFPLNLRSKTRRRATLLLPTWIYFLSVGRDGQLHTSLYDKRDDLNFHITNFPFLSSNIPSSPAYGVFFFSQLIRYASSSSSYECFILRAVRLSNKLLGQGYVKGMFKIVSKEVLWSVRGSYQTNMRSPSPECHKTFWMMTIYSDTLH